MRGPRFDSKLSDDAAQLNASIDFDQRLLPYDVEGSKAHARMLAAQGILLGGGRRGDRARARPGASTSGSAAS